MRRLARAVATALCAAALLLALGVTVVPALLGLQRYVIVGGSMTGTIPKGSVIYSRLTPVDELKVGDVVTFQPPGGSEAVTHRIIAVEEGSDGERVFRTKGDFNQSADPWGAIKLNGPRQARYVFHIPFVGYVLAALAIRQVRMLVVGLPAIVIALSLLWSLWRRAGEEVALQAENDGIPHDARSRA